MMMNMDELRTQLEVRKGAKNPKICPKATKMYVCPGSLVPRFIFFSAFF